ncbi:hypothetical protein BROUX41_005083 [Berkeleyomyces rouxiae]|uniref:uncharacterized protein n=1 Tax=Berkeleyomyces rouxiae TaxID=2035830 RepID=UPI003B82A9F7
MTLVSSVLSTCGFPCKSPKSTKELKAKKASVRHPAWLFQWDCAFYEEAKQLAGKLERRGLGSDYRYTHHYAWTKGYEEAFGCLSFHGTLPHEAPPPKQKRCTCAEEDAAWSAARKRERVVIVFRHLKQRLTEP